MKFKNTISEYFDENNYASLYILLALAVLENFSGLFTTILGTDGTLYACIAKTMVLKNDFVNLYNEGKDWLDKPHLPFWLTALSFKIFGFTNYAYKLPGILCTMLAARYTFLFGKTLYNKTIGLWSAIIFLTAQHIVISDADVRAEPYLTGFVIAAIFYFYQSYTHKKFYQLIAASIFTAFAIMTKGIFAVIPIVGAIGGELIIKKNWKELFNVRWFFAILFTFIFILPELYCLYMQFDMHPEKTVYEMHKVSGIKFFFWDSQFGRFMNTGPIKGRGDIFFFFHTLLWAFLPWSLLLYASYFYLPRKKTNYKNESWLCVCGSLLTFVVFSLSRFQLPYYLNFVFPLFAVITAKYLFDIKSEKTISNITLTQKIISVLVIIISFILDYYLQPELPDFFTFICVVLIFIILIYIFFPAAKKTFFTISVLASFFVNIFLNDIIYPELFKYQSGTLAAYWINKNENTWPVVRLQNDLSYAFEFYLNQPLNAIPDSSFKKYPKPFVLYANDNFIKKQINGNYKIKILQSFEEFHISMLTVKFINFKTRDSAISKYDLAIFY